MSDKTLTDGKSKTLANVVLKQGTSDEKQVPAHADEDLKFCTNDGSLIYYTVYDVCHRYSPFFISHVIINHTLYKL